VFGPGSDAPLVWYEGSGTSDRRFLHADERGSIVAVTNGSAVLQNVNRYDEHGKVQYTNPYYLDRFAFTGQRYFSGNGVYYYKNRLYDPKSGRFMAFKTGTAGRGSDGCRSDRPAMHGRDQRCFPATPHRIPHPGKSAVPRPRRAGPCGLTTSWCCRWRKRRSRKWKRERRPSFASSIATGR
jgi:hypothetical protein